jgi:hypothetical protein
MELDAPPRSPPVSGAGAGPPTGTSSAVVVPPDVGVAATGPLDGTWGLVALSRRHLGALCRHHSQ